MPTAASFPIDDVKAVRIAVRGGCPDPPAEDMGTPRRALDMGRYDIAGAWGGGLRGGGERLFQRQAGGRRGRVARPRPMAWPAKVVQGG